MAGKSYDACTAIPMHDGGTYWHKIGKAFTSDKGQISITFNSLPLPNREGQVRVFLFEPKAKEESQDLQTRTPAKKKSLKEDLGDEIPF